MIRLRPATDEDLRALGPKLAPLPLFTAYGLTAEKLTQRWLEGRARSEGLLVAEDEALLGICWFLRRGVFGIGGYLRTIALVPEAQGRGVGKLLLEAFEAGCESPSGGWFLLTSDFNEAAQRFYRREGYVEVGRMPPGFAAPGIGEVIFWKPRTARTST